VGGLVDQTVVGAEVDHLDRVRQLRGERRRGAVRKCQEDQVGADERVGRGRREDEIGDGPDVRVELPHGLPCVGLRGHGGELEIRMARDEPQ
jgi:hypothetical protein